MNQLSPKSESQNTANTDNSNKHRFTKTEKVIGALSALAIIGTSVLAVIKHRGKGSEETFKYVMKDGVLHKLFPGGKTVKVPEDAFKTVVKEDGSSERLLHNGHTVTIKPPKIQENGEWSQSIKVTDLNGNVIADRDKSFMLIDDAEHLNVHTFGEYNSDSIPRLTTSRSVIKKADSFEVDRTEWHYNEMGSGDDKNLEKFREESITWDKAGNRKEVYSKVQERSKAGPLDEHLYSANVEDNGNIYTSVSHTEHSENGMILRNQSHERVDPQGNILWDQEYFVEKDKIKGIEKCKSHDHSYYIDENGARNLKRSDSYRYTVVLDENGNPSDYLEFYSRNYSKGDASFDSIKRPHYDVRDYKRNDEGVGALEQYAEEVDGTQIEDTLKQKSGKDVKHDTTIWDK